MKVLLINGSPHEKGCTYTALAEVVKGISEYGVETEIFHIGRSIVTGCTECGGCTGKGRCAFTQDTVNAALDKAEGCDGFVFGSPVHYAGVSGNMKSFLDRLFYAGGGLLAFKPGAAVSSARRAGTTATFEQLTKYFAINSMPIVSSHYWNMVHGHDPSETMQDLEGLQIMRALGRNMGWLLRSIEAGKKSGVDMPAREQRIKTSFIR